MWMMCIVYDNSNNTVVVTLIFGKETCLASGQMPLDFGVAILNFRVTECSNGKITFGPETLTLEELRIRKLVLL